MSFFFTGFEQDLTTSLNRTPMEQVLLLQIKYTLIQTQPGEIRIQACAMGNCILKWNKLTQH